MTYDLGIFLPTSEIMNLASLYLAKASFGSPCEIYNAEYKKLTVWYAYLRIDYAQRMA